MPCGSRLSVEPPAPRRRGATASGKPSLPALPHASGRRCRPDFPALQLTMLRGGWVLMRGYAEGGFSCVATRRVGSHAYVSVFLVIYLVLALLLPERF